MSDSEEETGIIGQVVEVGADCQLGAGGWRGGQLPQQGVRLVALQDKAAPEAEASLWWTKDIPRSTSPVRLQKLSFADWVRTGTRVNKSAVRRAHDRMNKLEIKFFSRANAERTGGRTAELRSKQDGKFTVTIGDERNQLVLVLVLGVQPAEVQGAMPEEQTPHLHPEVGWWVLRRATPQEAVPQRLEGGTTAQG